jgi:pteridine reductase
VPHGITKAGVVQMTRALARVMAPRVRVNAVAPGAVLLPDDWDERGRDHLIETTPLKRLGSPDDVSRAVIYLIEADYVTGDTLIVDGGRHVRS